MYNDKAALKILQDFLKADLVERNTEKALSFLSRDIWWYGTAEGEDVQGIEMAREYFQKEMRLSPHAYEVEYLQCRDQSQNDGSGTAHAKCRVTGGGVTAICRCSASIRPEDGAAKIYALHMSVPDAAQQDGEFFPFSLAEKYKRELQLEFLNELVDGGILGRIADGSAEIFTVNRQLLDFLGYPSEQVFRNELHNCANNTVHPDDLAAGLENVMQQLNVASRYCVEYRMRRRDGSYVWVEAHGKKIDTDDGRKAVVSIIQDISARKQQQMLVLARDEEIRNLYDTIPGGVFICKFNADWDVTFANKGFYDFLGYTREEFAEQFHNKMIGVIYEDDKAPMLPILQRQLLKGNSIENVNRLVCKGGVVKWISIHAVLSRGDDGEGYFYCTFVNITEQKTAEQKLKQSEQQYRIAIEGAGVNVWEYDLKSHRIILPPNNPKAVNGNYVLENVPEALPEKLGVSDEQQEELREMFRRLERGEQKVSGEFWLDNPQTHTRWCERVTYSTVYDDQGNPIKTYGAGMDITQSKLAEKRYQEELSYRDSVAESIAATCCVNLNTRKVEAMRIAGQVGLEKEHSDCWDYRTRTEALSVFGPQ